MGLRQSWFNEMCVEGCREYNTQELTTENLETVRKYAPDNNFGDPFERRENGGDNDVLGLLSYRDDHYSVMEHALFRVRLMRYYLNPLLPRKNDDYCVARFRFLRGVHRWMMLTVRYLNQYHESGLHEKVNGLTFNEYVQNIDAYTQEEERLRSMKVKHVEEECSTLNLCYDVEGVSYF